MAGMTVEQWTTLRDKYLLAAEKIASGQSFQVAGRNVTRADLASVMKMIEWCEENIGKLETSGSRTGLRVRYGVSIS